MAAFHNSNADEVHRRRDNPEPFVWTSCDDGVLDNVARGHTTLDPMTKSAIHNSVAFWNTGHGGGPLTALTGADVG